MSFLSWTLEPHILPTVLSRSFFDSPYLLAQDKCPFWQLVGFDLHHHTKYLRVVESVREFPNILKRSYHFSPAQFPIPLHSYIWRQDLWTFFSSPGLHWLQDWDSHSRYHYYPGEVTDCSFTHSQVESEGQKQTTNFQAGTFICFESQSLSFTTR